MKDILGNIINRFKVKGHYYWNLYQTREKLISLGEENPNLYFYIIRVDFEMAGLFAIVKTMLSHIKYAIDKGYIPIIDMEHAKNCFQNDIPENPWEYFFQQPTQFTLKDTLKSKHIIISCNRQTPQKQYKIGVDLLLKQNLSKLSQWAQIYHTYINPNIKTQNYLSDNYNKIIGDKKNILGVLCRGTDYTDKRPANHPIQPSPEMVINKIHELKKNLQIDWIYLATEDIRILNLFKEKFGNQLLYINQQRFGVIESNFLSDYKFQDNSRIEMNLDYYSSLYILSQCDYFIGGRTSGTIGSYLMATKQFKYNFFWDLGTYPSQKSYKSK